jgi:hypothetical protein
MPAEAAYVRQAVPKFCLRSTAMTEANDGKAARLREVARAQPVGQRDMVQAVVGHARIGIGRPKDHMRIGQAWIESNRLGQSSHGWIETARGHVHEARCEVRPGVLRVAADRPLRHVVCGRQGRFRIGQSKHRLCR